MSTRVDSSPGGPTYTLKKGGLLACVYWSQKLAAKKEIVSQGMDQICPQVSGMGEKKKKKKKERNSWLNTNPGKPCKLRNSSFTNSKEKRGKLTQLVLPLCLLSNPFLCRFSCAVGGGCHGEQQGLQRELEKGPIQELLVLPVWDSLQKTDNKHRLQRRKETVTVIHLLQDTFDRQLFPAALCSSSTSPNSDSSKRCYF